MTVRVITPAEAEDVFNQADIRPWLGPEGDGRLRLPCGAGYLECRGVICMMHGSYWPGVFMVHIAAPKDRRGPNCLAACKEMLNWIRKTYSPTRITAWSSARNRAVVSLARRLGFVVDGIMDMRGETVLMMGTE